MASKAKHPHNKKTQPTISMLNIPFSLIILAYIFIPFFAPNLNTLDTNGPKFWSLAIINLLAFLFLFVNGDIRNKNTNLSVFFHSYAGLALTGLLIMSLISFTKAINVEESIIQISKLFSVFMAAVVLTSIIVTDLRFIRMIAVVVTGILVFDSLSVFYFINKFINGEISGIIEIKSVYSNKNILASSIFVKAPFALWLFVFEKGWLKRLGLFTVAIAFTATYFMSARAFYVGIIGVSIVFAAYCVAGYLRDKQKQHLRLLGLYAGAVIFAFTVFSVTERYIYPRDKGDFTNSVAERMATINTGDGSIQIRLNAWKWTVEMIKANPLLGVGSGNWKVAVLEKENQKKPDYIYSYKTHNDFLETTAETGIPGGLLFLGIFVLLAWGFLQRFLKQTNTINAYKYPFLAASGIFFYSFDATFNFPADRPEILVLFYLFIAIGAASLYVKNPDQPFQRWIDDPKNKKTASWLTRGLSIITIVLLLVPVWLFYENFKSLRLQRVIFQEIKSGQLRSPSNKFLKEFPTIPNLSIWGESISSLKARYLIQEGKYKQAVEVLKDDLSNPYDARRESFMAVAFNQLNQPDSALKYAQVGYQLKPFYFRNTHLFLTLLEQKQRDEEVKPIIDSYLAETKTAPEGYLYATNFYVKMGEVDKAYGLIEQAMQYLSGDTLIQKQQRYLHYKKFVEPHMELYNKANTYYSMGNYSQAVIYYSQILEVAPFDASVVSSRAISYYRLQQYEKSIADLNTLFEKGSKTPSLQNLRGVCYRELNQMEQACKDFQAAMKAGDKDGSTNHRNFCGAK